MPPLGRLASGTFQPAAKGNPKTVLAVELVQTDKREASELRRSPSKKSSRSSNSAATASDLESTKMTAIGDRRGVDDQ